MNTPKLMLARLGFLLEYGEEEGPSPLAVGMDTNDVSGTHGKSQQPNLLPQHHLLYANSKCILVFYKTRRWLIIQTIIFLLMLMVRNVKQAMMIAVFLGK
jgi:hypothetical protein